MNVSGVLTMGELVITMGTKCVIKPLPYEYDDILVNPKNSSGFTDSIFKLLEDDSLRGILSKNTLKYSKTYDWNITNKSENIIDEVLK